MKGAHLKFYVLEFRKHRGILLYEWLLEKAKETGVHGGSAFRAIAGYGKHGILHEAHFYELQGTLQVEVVFTVTDDEAEKLLNIIKEEKISLFYVKIPAEYGIL